MDLYNKSFFSIFLNVKNFLLKNETAVFTPETISKTLGIKETYKISEILKSLVKTQDESFKYGFSFDKNKNVYFFKNRFKGIFKETSKISGKVFSNGLNKSVRVRKKKEVSDGDIVLLERISADSYKIYDVLKKEEEFEAVILDSKAFSLTPGKPRTEELINSKEFEDFEFVRVTGTEDSFWAESLGERSGLKDKELIKKLAREGYPLKFERKALDETKTLKDKDKDKRRDLRNEYTFSLYNEGEKDISNAFSLIKDKNNFILKVHVSDVSAFIGKNTALDRNAIKRGRTLFTPDGNIPILPKVLSEDRLSFKEGEIREALTLEAFFDENYNLKKTGFYLSLIEVDRNLSFPEADKLLKDPTELGETLKILESLSLKLKKRREGIDFDLPEFIFTKKKEITNLKNRENYKSPSYQIKKELMIFLNSEAGKALKTYLGVYKVQSPPDKFSSLNNWLELKGEETVKDDFTDRFKEQDEYGRLKFFRACSKSYLSPVPLSNFSLGVKAYSPISDPLRNYSDLLAGRYLKEALFSSKYGPRSLTVLENQIGRLEKSLERVRKERTLIRKFYNRKAALSLKLKPYSAVITGVKEFGLFIRLESGIEGIVFIEDLGGLSLDFDQRGRLSLPDKDISYIEGDSIKVYPGGVSEDGAFFVLEAKDPKTLSQRKNNYFNRENLILDRSEEDGGIYYI